MYRIVIIFSNVNIYFNIIIYFKNIFLIKDIIYIYICILFIAHSEHMIIYF
jgi:hypothetical protein